MALITIQASELHNIWQTPNMPIPLNPELRIGCSDAFVAAGTTNPIQIQPYPFSYLAVTCAYNAVTGVLLIPQFSLYSTLDGLDIQSALYTFYLFSGPGPNGQPLCQLRGLIGIPLDDAPTITNLPAVQLAARTNINVYPWNASATIAEIVSKFWSSEPLPPNDTVPSVINGYSFVTQNTLPTNYTSFSFRNSYNGQPLFLFFGDNVSSLFGNPKALGDFSIVAFSPVDEQWHELTAGSTAGIFDEITLINPPGQPTHIQGAPGMTAPWTLTLPPNDGNAGQVLSTDGAGNTTWINQTGGGGGSTFGFYNPMDYGAHGDGVTNDTAAFNTMLSAIGSNLATVMIPRTGSQFVLSNITFPANVTLNFEPSGGLWVVTGQRITILGNIEAPIVQIFFNCKSLAGQGEINFGTTTTGSLSGNRPFAGPMPQYDYYAAWFGAIGDNVTDCADSLDAAFRALPNGCNMYLTDQFYKVGHTVTLNYKFQSQVIGNQGEVGYSNAICKPFIVWIGALNGTVFKMNNCYACTIKGFGIFNSDGSAPAASTGIYMTFDAVAAGSPNISSHNYIENNVIYALVANSNWIGLNIDNANGSNNEQHTIRENQFQGTVDHTATTQIGVRTGHIQCKNLIYDRNTFANVGVGISGSGNFQSRNNIFSNVGTAYQSIQWVEAVSMKGDDCEIINCVIDHGGAVILMDSCRYSLIYADCLTPATAAIRVNGAAAVDIRGSYYISSTNPVRFGPYFFADQGGGKNTPVNFVDCQWDNNAAIDNLYPGFATAHTCVQNGSQKILFGGGSQFDPGLLLAGTSPTALTPRPLITMPGPGAGGDPVSFGSGSFAFGGLYQPQMPSMSGVGAAGGSPVSREFTILAVDAQGRRTTSATDPGSGGGLSKAITWNATLDATNYIHFAWPAQYPSPDHFVLYDVNPLNRLTWRFVANIVPSGTANESYDLQFNPVGAYVAKDVGRDEAEILLFRNTVLNPTELIFPDGAGSPNVAAANDFVTSNSTLVTITNFAGPTLGQIIRVRAGDANTTVQNNSNIVTGTGADVTLLNGAVYTFIYRANKWHLMGAAPAPASLPPIQTDSPNNRVGINKFPTTILDILSTEITELPHRMTLTQIGGSLAAAIAFQTALGTLAALAAVSAGTAIASLWGRAYDGGNYNDIASIRMRASENQTPTAQGSHVSVSTTLIGTSGPRVVADFLDTGDLNIPVGNLLFAASALHQFAAKVLGATSGGSVLDGWLVDAGIKRLAAQFDKIADTALAPIPGLSVNVAAGRSYTFRLVLFLTQDVTGAGQFQITGTATATNVTYDYITAKGAAGGTAGGTAVLTALGTTIAIGNAVIMLEVEGSILVNAAGTLLVQYSQAIANGTSSVLVGSSFTVRDTGS